MTFAPALILLGEPLLVLWHGLPRLGKVLSGPVFRLPFMQRFARMLSRPALCWGVSALTLLGWHVPALFALGMNSEVWHCVEQASFLGRAFFSGCRLFGLGLVPQPGRNGRPFYICFLPRCRATSSPGFSCFLTALRIPSTSPCLGTLPCLFWKISSAPLR